MDTKGEKTMIVLVCMFLLVAESMIVQNIGKVFINDRFEQADGLVTNEYAYWNPRDSFALRSPVWEMTSGSLFVKDKAAWSGVPDSGTPDRLSAKFNNSAIFRLTTKRADFGDVEINFDLWNEKLSSTQKTPPEDWDGLHVFLRYQSQYNLYYVSVNRRDDRVVVKKKIPDGPSNGGTYYALSNYEAYPVPYQSWQRIRVTVKNNSDGSVGFDFFANGKKVLSVIDDGTIGGPPIRTPGKVGLRADNAEIKFKNFTVSSL